MSQTHTGLLTHQIKQIERVILILIIAITFWLGFSGSSFVLVAQGVLITSFYIHKLNHNQLRVNKFFHQRFWHFFWVVSSSFLIAAFSILNFVKLATPFTNPVAGAITLIAISSLVAQIILIVGIEKKPLKMEFFRENSSWILTLITGLTIQFSSWYILDAAVALFLLVYLLVTNLQVLYKEDEPSLQQADTSPEKYQLDDEVVAELTTITKLEKLGDFEVIKMNQDFFVAGKLVVANNSSQEDIFEIKTKAKKVLAESGFENSVLETVYLAEVQNHKK
jgi:hypothetical protein